jgi:hypothetical protein
MENVFDGITTLVENVDHHEECNFHRQAQSGKIYELETKVNEFAENVEDLKYMVGFVVGFNAVALVTMAAVGFYHLTK